MSECIVSINSVERQSTNNEAKAIWLSIHAKCFQRASEILFKKGAFLFSLRWKDD